MTKLISVSTWQSLLSADDLEVSWTNQRLATNTYVT